MSRLELTLPPRPGLSRGRRRAAARDLQRLLADFGHQLPDAPTPLGKPSDPRLFTELIGRSGPMRAYRGWSPVRAPLAVWRMTSEQLGGVWPMIAAPGLPPTGAWMGVDIRSGGAMYCDPVGWTLNDEIPVTAPNIVVFGKPGRGKSGIVKIFLIRMTDFGYRILILGDVKDEYEPVCRAFGVEPFAIGPGMTTRVNPLDRGPLGEGWADLDRDTTLLRSAQIFGRWLVLLAGLVGAAGVSWTPTWETVVGAALREITGYTEGNTLLADVTVPQLWHALDEPSDSLVRTCRYASRQDFLDSTRALRDALGSLVKGSLAGMFDAETNIDIDWLAPIQSMSLSRLEPLGDQAVGTALLCLNSWGRAMREITAPGDLRIVVRDEMWMQTALGIGPVKSLNADLRLSRRDGDVQLVIGHKPSDFESAGDAGSQAARIAKDLLALFDTKILLGQDADVANDLHRLLKLDDLGVDEVTDWAMQAKGRALWLVGDRSFKVQSIRTRPEIELTHTNDNLKPA